MTALELAEELGISETYLRNHWPRIVRNRAETGVILMKRGRGDSAQYGIKNYGDEDVRWVSKKRL